MPKIKGRTKTKSHNKYETYFNIVVSEIIYLIQEGDRLLPLHTMLLITLNYISLQSISHCEQSEEYLAAVCPPPPGPCTNATHHPCTDAMPACPSSQTQI